MENWRKQERQRAKISKHENMIKNIFTAHVLRLQYVPYDTFIRVRRSNVPAVQHNVQRTVRLQHVLIVIVQY